MADNRSGAMTGGFLKKQTLAPGRLVFPYFEVMNAGTETQELVRADPYSSCSGHDDTYELVSVT